MDIEELYTDDESTEETEAELLEVPEDYQEDTEAVTAEEIVVEETDISGKKKVNFISNKEMFREVHLSKCTFSEFTNPEYSEYDLIVSDINEIFLPESQATARTNRINRLATQAHAAATSESPESRLRRVDFKNKYDQIDLSDLVFRVMTFEHIPTTPGRKKNPKSTADGHERLNFPPFKHFIIQDGNAVEVGRSHSKDGEFSMTHGSITRRLAEMLVLMVNRYAQRGNWRGYTYLEEMKGQALLQLTSMVLKFDESRSQNIFGYATTISANSFLRVFNVEKRTQNLRDDLLINSGASPSFSRQLAEEEAVRKLREEAIERSKYE